MKIGILSDSHDHLPNLKKALEIFRRRGCEKIIHAGDFVSPFVMLTFKEFNLPVTGVFGNNDGDWLMLSKAGQGVCEIKKGPVELELAGRKIALMHEPVFMDALMSSNKFDLIVFGHTHQASVQDPQGKGPLTINPGACCGIMTDRATAAVCDLKSLGAKLIEL